MILVGTVIQIKDNIQSKVLAGLNKNKITLDGTGLIPDNKNNRPSRDDASCSVATRLGRELGHSIYMFRIKH